MIIWLRFIFMILCVRPVVFILLGLNTRRHELLPDRGPAIVAANHNSHLDTLVLICLWPLQRFTKIRPVGLAEYFLSTPVLSWFATRILRIIPVQPGSGRSRRQVLAGALDALDDGDIVIVFPEGTRGVPDRMQPLRSGIATLANLRPRIPVYPVYLHGTGKALPKGTALLLPCVCEARVGRPLHGSPDEADFMRRLSLRLYALSREGGSTAP